MPSSPSSLRPPPGGGQACGGRAAAGGRPVRGAGPLAVAILLLSGCGTSPSAPAAASFDDPAEIAAVEGSDRSALFRDVRIVDPSTGDVRAGRSVLVADGRIARVGPMAAVQGPEGAAVVEGGGRYLVPGLADMHVHLSREDLPRYLESGVTTVRNLWGHPAIREMIDRVAAGDLPGPTVRSVSPGIDAHPERWPYTQFVDRPEQAAGVVAALEEAGWRTLKVYQDLSRASYDAVVAEARARGLALVGHVPTEVDLFRVLDAGQRSVEHLAGYARELDPAGRRGPAGWAAAEMDGMRALADRTAGTGTWICPTLAIQLELGRSLPEDARRAGAGHRRRAVAELHRAGVPLLVGTDAGIEVVAPGASIHVELVELVASGLSHREAMRAATEGAAAYFAAADEFGAVRVGLRADLLLLAGNPYADVGALRRLHGVMVRGRWRSTAEGWDGAFDG